MTTDPQSRHIFTADPSCPPRPERAACEALADMLAATDRRVDALSEQLPSQIEAAVSRAMLAHTLTPEQRHWVELAIQREAQSIRLRQAIIEKTLTGLVWAAVLGAGSIIYQWLQAHGWRS